METIIISIKKAVNTPRDKTFLHWSKTLVPMTDSEVSVGGGLNNPLT